jgi:hypothetical protein
VKIIAFLQTLHMVVATMFWDIKPSILILGWFVAICLWINPWRKFNE